MWYYMWQPGLRAPSLRLLSFVSRVQRWGTERREEVLQVTFVPSLDKQYAEEECRSITFTFRGGKYCAT
jgi:hypothetical protein